MNVWNSHDGKNVIEVMDFEEITEKKENVETRSSVLVWFNLVVTVLFTLSMLLSVLMVLGVLVGITLDAAGIISLPSQLNVIPIKAMAPWMGAAGLAWGMKLVCQQYLRTPRSIQGTLAAAAAAFTVLTLICGYGFLKENCRVFFPLKPVSIQYEFTGVDSAKPLLDENGEFQIGMDGSAEVKLPDACTTGSKPLQVGRLSESEAWRKQFTVDPDALMEYGNRCHVYNFILSSDGTTATLRNAADN